MSLQLTENAAKEIKKVIAEQKMPENVTLRVGVAGGGCSGNDFFDFFGSVLGQLQ